MPGRRLPSVDRSASPGGGRSDPFMRTFSTRWSATARWPGRNARASVTASAKWVGATDKEQAQAGTACPKPLFDAVRAELTERFGGVTAFVRAMAVERL